MIPSIVLHKCPQDSHTPDAPRVVKINVDLIEKPMCIPCNVPLIPQVFYCCMCKAWQMVAKRENKNITLKCINCSRTLVILKCQAGDYLAFPKMEGSK